MCHRSASFREAPRNWTLPVPHWRPLTVEGLIPWSRADSSQLSLRELPQNSGDTVKVWEVQDWSPNLYERSRSPFQFVRVPNQTCSPSASRNRVEIEPRAFLRFDTHRKPTALFLCVCACVCACFPVTLLRHDSLGRSSSSCWMNSL